MMDAMPQGDVRPRSFAPLYVVPKALIHEASERDKPFMLALAQEKYPRRVVEKSIRWVERAMDNPDRLVLVGPNSFGIAQADWIYGSERRGRLDMMCARTEAAAGLAAGVEILRMVEIMVGWARTKGCAGTFKLDADTGVDFEPLAQRLGGKVVTVKRCEIPL